VPRPAPELYDRREEFPPATECLITDAFDFKARSLANTKSCKMTEIPADWEAVDIGP
jgi:hypothetical protein